MFLTQNKTLPPPLGITPAASYSADNASELDHNRKHQVSVQAVSGV